MRKLLNTLYVNNPESFLMLENENIIVKINDETKLKAPLLNFESIISCGYRGATTQLMIACANMNINISFIKESGTYLGTFIGETKGNILLRKEQYRISDEEERSLHYAKLFIVCKLYNSRWVIERTTRDHPIIVNIAKLKHAINEIKTCEEKIMDCKTLDDLRLIEGNAAQRYFEVFDDLILQNKSDFYFKNRNKRPPIDNLNCLLSLTYSMIAHDYRGACSLVGLDPYSGFLHRDRPGRVSLALDLMEELRSCLADRFVLYLINLKILNGKDFIKSETGAVSLTENGRKKYFNAWQERKRGNNSPILKRKS